MKMKRILMGCLSLGLLIAGCSDDEKIESVFVVGDEWTELANTYNVDRTRITVDYYTPGSDTAYVFFNGRIDGRLWIGGYEKESKKKILDWTESSKLDTLGTVDLGYGEIAKYLVNKWTTRDFHKRDNYLCFILNSTKDGHGYGLFNDLYFLNRNYLVIKHRNVLLYSDPNDAEFRNIIEWHDGVLVSMWRNGIILRYECYDMNGTHQFSTKQIPENSTSVNFEEYIQYTINNTNKTIDFLRGNLKTGETIWKNTEKTIIDNSNETIRIDNVSIQKEGLIWVYTINYTRYSGEKKTIKASVNVQTGEIKIL